MFNYDIVTVLPSLLKPQLTAD